MNTESQKKKILQLFKDRGVKAGGLYPLPEFMADAGVPGEGSEAFEELIDAGLLVEWSAAMELTEKGAEAIELL